jgi:glycosyltransferase involved in cell wall biosynthesis
VKILLDFQFVQCRAGDVSSLNRWLSTLLGQMYCGGNCHETVVCLNASLSAASMDVQSQLLAALPPVKIEWWDPLKPLDRDPVSDLKGKHKSRMSHKQRSRARRDQARRDQARRDQARKFASEKIRETFLASLDPDVILIPMFSGLKSDTAVFSTGGLLGQIPTVILVDSLSETDEAFDSERDIIESADHVFYRNNNDNEFIVAALRKLIQGLRSASSLNASSGEPLSLAMVSPLPPLKSGISYYSVELASILSRTYQITLITNQEVTGVLLGSFDIPVHSPEWLFENRHKFDRVLYHVGNNPLHEYMLEMLEELPGVVVLHDFILCDLYYFLQSNGRMRLDDVIYESHGYEALSRFCKNDVDINFWKKYPSNFRLVKSALGLIVHCNELVDWACNVYGSSVKDKFRVVPMLRTAQSDCNKDDARLSLHIKRDEFVVCCFGFIAPHKLNCQILDAFSKSCLAKDHRVKLIFCGGSDNSYGKALLEELDRLDLGENVVVTGFLSDDDYQNYLVAADMAVQLRKFARGETSATILDCLNASLPLITNEHLGLGRLNHTAAKILPEYFTTDELVLAFNDLYNKENMRVDLSNNASAYMKSEHCSDAIARKYVDYIEDFYRKSNYKWNDCLNSLISNAANGLTDDDKWDVAKALSGNCRVGVGLKSILVDVSGICVNDLKTGIQRVVKNILRELLSDPPAGYRVEPVRLSSELNEYVLATEFSLRFLDIDSGGVKERESMSMDRLIDYKKGDIFIGLDLYPPVKDALECFMDMKNCGVEVHFVLYDIIPITHHQFFPREFSSDFSDWARFIYKISDRIISISKASADAFIEWSSVQPDQPQCVPVVDHFCLGSDFVGRKDIGNLEPPLSDASLGVLEAIKSGISLVYVSTIEPRKGHTQLLDSFEILWSQGVDVNLVIVGKEGWNVGDFVTRLRIHPEFGCRLFWLERISDNYLSEVYRASSGLVFASESEGFGLALVEAALYDLPIIARDIPVFREVAGDHAYYFSGTQASSLAASIKEWLSLRERGQLKSTKEMPVICWQESSREFIGAMSLSVE